MSPDKAWKAAERRAAQILGGTGKRFWANSGEDVDVQNDGICAQVKNVRVLSFAALEKLCVEAERQGHQRDRIGIVILKRRGGRGVETRWIIALTDVMWREMSGPLPGDRTTGEAP